MAGKEEKLKGIAEAHKMIESLRSRASAEQLAFFSVSTASILLVLRTALLLNGGSIIALPPFFTTFVNGENSSICVIAVSSFLFFLGIISAVYASFLNYRNYMHGVDWVSSNWEDEIEYIKDEYLGDSYGGTMLYSGLNRSNKDAWGKIVATYRIGIFLISFSYIFFILGYMVAVFAIIVG